VTEDVLYPQLRKAHRAFVERFEREGFAVHDARFDVAGKEALFLFEFSIASLPRVLRHEGPPVWVKNAKEFLEKWESDPRTLAGPFIVQERWTVDVAREFTDPTSLARASWRSLSLGKDLEKSAKRSLRLYAGSAALRAAYADAWTRLFDKRFAWER